MTDAAAAAFEFWFDFSCPYAYLASSQVEALAARTGATMEVCPFLLGGVFRARGTAQNLAHTLGSAKAAHNAADLQRHADLFDVPLGTPHHHPMRTVGALRALLAAHEAGHAMMPLVHRFYAAYWIDGVDLSTDDGVADILRAAGLDADALLARSRDPAIKDDLRRRTDVALDRGVFGAPAFVVGDDLYWGQDRLHEVEAALGGDVPAPVPDPDARCVFYFDYSSPFTYLAATRVDRLFAGGVDWRPMLLGAVFKQVGAPNVPLFAMNDARRAWSDADLSRQAAAAGVPLVWNEHFPVNTVRALRMTILADPNSAPGKRFVRRVFDATWVENEDVSDPDVLARLADEAGLDGADLVARAAEPEAKHALFEATAAAVAANVFGAPTFVVGDELFWGNDRLELALSSGRR